MNHRDMGEIVLRMSRKRKGGTGATSTASSRAAPSVLASSGESGARALPPPRTTRASSPTKKLPVKRARVESSIVGGTGTPLSADVLAARIQEAFGELYEQRTLPPPLPPGMAVAYSAPSRHFCLSVVENNYCASKRGGVRCLFVLNVVFAVIFGLLSLFLGSSLLTLGSRCSIPLFWCYEITTWGLVALYGGAAFFLRRKAASVLDEGNYSGRNLGLEMLESSPPVNPDMQGRVNEGFRAWMGSSLLSSDDEEDVNDYSSLEEAHPILINSSRQRG